jgi:two-component system, cell cycle response regulator DivK
VDDDEPSTKLMSVMLRAEGCDVQIAASAEEAIARLAVFRPQAMIVDLVLPRMSGIQLARQLKRDPATRDIPLIAVTAFNGSLGESVAREAGFVEYVRKPIDAIAFPDLLLAQLGGVR